MKKSLTESLMNNEKIINNVYKTVQNFILTVVQKNRYILS